MSTSQDEDKPPAKGEIAVVDFAAQTGLPTGKISAPQTKEEWDTFITRYTLGEYNNCSFVDENPTPASRRPSTSQDPSAESPASPFDGALHIDPPHIMRDLIKPDPHYTTPPLDIESDSSGPESSGSRPEVSKSGAANQDPDIPNIDADDLPVASTSTQRIAQKMEVKEGERAIQAGAMTRENMRRLGQEQQDDRVREREGPKRSVRRGGRRRERDHAELASAGRRSYSAGSSSDDEAPAPKAPPRRRHPRRPRSRGSWASRHTHSQSGSLRRNGTAPSLDNALFESGTNDSTSASQVELTYDHGAERARVKEFFETHGYMPAPRQPPEIARRRLRVVRRLGLDRPDSFHREELDRFTRLAKSFFKCHAAFINIITKDKQIALSEMGATGLSRPELDLSLCCHTIMTPGAGEQCMVVNDAAKDWRFRNSPLVQDGKGPIQFYAGAPLRVGHGTRMTVIGSLCVVDSKAREWSEDKNALLLDLADCVVSELELIYSQQATVESAKLHQISVDFLRRSLKHRPNERAGQSVPDNATASSTSSTTGKRKEGADNNQSEVTVDIYDEACREIRTALDAYAVAVVDLSQFHLFYPAYQNSSTGGGSSTRGGSTTGPARSNQTGGPSTYAGGGSTARQASTVANSTIGAEDPEEAYSKPVNRKRALPTYATTDIMAPSRTPQVLYIPSRRKSDPKNQKYAKQSAAPGQESLSVLGYSCGHDGFAFNLTSSPAARKIISDFIASNVKTRRVWYTRDDSEGIAQSITHLMPAGTETSMAMPVFGFDGQVSFAVVACWTDPLYTYPAGALQFIETIAGSLLASVMKERLHQAERAQLNFAAAASHELRTPLHQINAAASLLRSTLHAVLKTPTGTPASEHSEQSLASSVAIITAEDRLDALAQLEIIEANGLSLGSILENIIDTLDIGKMASKMQLSSLSSTDPLLPGSSNAALHDPTSSTTNNSGKKEKAEIVDFGEVLENVVRDAITLETKARRIQGAKSLDQVEVIVEVLPRNRGGWLINKDMGALSRALSKIIHNAVKFTDTGHVHITVQDISRDVVLPAGYDNSVRLSTVSIDVKDTGRGMSNEFLDKEVLRPFAKEDAFTTGSGLGLGLAQRMIELLGGKLAIASTLGKGTLVHVEVPVHLLNQDNESDQDAMPTDESELEESLANADIEAAMSKVAGAGGSGGNKTERSGGRMGVELVRRDGIYLAGWTESKDSGVRRVGKSLTRQLKLHFCRVVAEINYASLIVIPEGGISDGKLADLCRIARPGVQVIVLRKDRSRQAHGTSTTNTDESDQASGFTVGPIPLAEDPTNEAIVNPVANFLRTIPITYLARPLRPSVIRQIIEPVEAPPHEPETFVSDVVGGDEARREHAALGSGASRSSKRAGSMTSSRGNSILHSVPSVVHGPETSEDEHVVPSHAGSISDSSFSKRRPSRAETQAEHANTRGHPGHLNREESSMTTATMATSLTDLTNTTNTTTDTNITTTTNNNSISGAEDGEADTFINSAPESDGNNSEVQQHHHHHHHHHDHHRLGPPPHPRSSVSESPASLISDLSAMTSGSVSGEENGNVRGDVTTGVQSPTTERSLRDLGLDEDNLPRSRIKSKNPLKVLVVEDNAVNRRILTTMLKRTACEYVEAVDGVEAVAQFRSFRPDLVLLDITMPRKDGFAAAAEMRQFEAASDIEITPSSPPPTTDGELEQGVASLSLVERSESESRSNGTNQQRKKIRARIIAVTAMSAEHQRRRGLVECQIDSWHVKPVSMKELRGIVEGMKREREEELARMEEDGSASASVEQ